MRSSLKNNSRPGNPFAVGCGRREGAPPTKTCFTLSAITTSLLLLTSTDLAAAEKAVQPDVYEDSHLIMKVMTRTPEQLIAFYSARGFNQASIDAITERCFVFAMAENKESETLWLILDDWEIIDASGTPIAHIKRADWKQIWQNTDLPQAKQSTFGWTQLPESRDLHQHEQIGGQFSLPWQDQPFKLIANYRTVKDKSGPVRKVVFEGLKCSKQ